PSERNTDLQFDYAVTNTGKRGTYRIVWLDTGQVLASGQIGTDVSPLTTFQNQFAASGLLPGTPVAIQVQRADGSWSTVDSLKVHYPAEPGDSQRYLDDAGYRGDFTVPDLATPSPSPSPPPSATPSPTATASATATASSARSTPSPAPASGEKLSR
ncbi:MAG: hypothetical protein JO069_23050, partial [Verrucomicrobia bacterium]|nr:hypothetical protein [Verrucomicrobiota bacterium]